MGIANIINTSTSSGGGGGEIIRELVNSSDGQGLHFDGASSHISIANSASAEFGTSDFSIEFILNQTQASTDETYYFTAPYTGDNRMGFWYDKNNTTLKIYFRATSNVHYAFGYDIAADFGSPTHFVVSADRSGNAVLYRNGTEVGSVDISGSSAVNIGNSNANPFYISANAASTAIIGSLYRFRTFSKALSHDEVNTCFQRADVKNALKTNLLIDLDLAFSNPSQSLMVQNRAGAPDGTASSGVSQTQPIVQLNSTSARIGTTAATPADGELLVSSNITQAAGVFTKTGTNGNFSVDAAGQTLDLSRNGGNYLFANGGASASLQIQGQHSLQFSTGASQTERMRIDSAGLVTANNRLSVVDNAAGATTYANFGPTTIDGATREGGLQIHASSGSTDKTWGIFADANPNSLKINYLGARATAISGGTNALSIADSGVVTFAGDTAIGNGFVSNYVKHVAGLDDTVAISFTFPSQASRWIHHLIELRVAMGDDGATAATPTFLRYAIASNTSISGITQMDASLGAGITAGTSSSGTTFTITLTEGSAVAMDSVTAFGTVTAGHGDAKPTGMTVA